MNRRMIFEALDIKEACKEGQKDPTRSNRAKYHSLG